MLGSAHIDFRSLLRGITMLKTKLLLLLVASCGTLTAQTASPQWNTPKPGVKEVQVPLASLKPSATIKVGGTADWVLLTEDAVWITTTKPYSLRRIDPATNKVVASVRLSGEACSGLESGGAFGHQSAARSPHWFESMPIQTRSVPFSQSHQRVGREESQPVAIASG